ncbi:MAG TPA: hypothetical protein VKJ45_20510, partial [Blastocatellia bacterium]|nr:hypothetical protein [Blastocatellia bacterium]
MSRKDLTPGLALTLAVCLVAVATGYSTRASSSQQRGGFDIIIKNGRVIDGTGSPWYAADVAIRDGRI